MTHAEWLDVCEQICRLWPHRPMPPEAAEAWYPLLADLDGEAVSAAVRAVALEPDNAWPPSLGQLRAAAVGDGMRPWEHALADLRGAVARVGAHRSPPSFTDPALEDVVASWGWQTVCAMQVADPTVRAQFRDAYQAACRRAAEHERREVAGLSTGHLRALEGGA